MTDGLVTTRNVLDLSKHGSLEDAVAQCLVNASRNSLSAEQALEQARQMIEDAREQTELRRAA